MFKSNFLEENSKQDTQSNDLKGTKYKMLQGGQSDIWHSPIPKHAYTHTFYETASLEMSFLGFGHCLHRKDIRSSYDK